MSSDLLTVEATVSIIEVAQRMVERNVGAVLVLEAGRLAGIMTERDLLRAVAPGLRDDAVVGECMTADPDTIAPDDTIEHAAVLMIHGGYRHPPVVDGDDVVGVLSNPRPGAGRGRGLGTTWCMSGHRCTTEA
jgi:CBS domain-containing protein